jgi:hypothetical protein
VAEAGLEVVFAGAPLKEVVVDRLRRDLLVDLNRLVVALELRRVVRDLEQRLVRRAAMAMQTGMGMGWEAIYVTTALSPP